MGVTRARGLESQGGVWSVAEAERIRGGVRFAESVPGSVPGVGDSYGGVYVVGMPVRETFCRWLETPFSDRRKALKVLPTLFDIELPFALDSCNYAFVDLHKSDKGNFRALGIGARRASIEKRLESCRQAGWDPEIFDHEGLALWEYAVRYAQVSADERIGTLLVHVAEGGAATLVIGKGTRFLNAHAVPAANPSEWARLIKAALGSWSGDYRWIWAGAVAGDDAAFSACRAAAEQRWPGPAVVLDAPGTVLSRALAWSALEGGGLGRNLRSGNMAQAAWTRRVRRRSCAAAFGLAIVGLLLLVVALYTQWGVRRHVARLEASVARLANDLSGGASGAALGSDALLICRRSVAEEVSRLKPYTSLRDPSLMARVASILTSCHDLKILVREFSLESNDAVTLRGSAPGWPDSEALKARMEALGFVVVLERGDAAADGWIPFSMTSKAGDT